MSRRKRPMSETKTLLLSRLTGWHTPAAGDRLDGRKAAIQHFASQCEPGHFLVRPFHTGEAPPPVEVILLRSRDGQYCLCRSSLNPAFHVWTPIPIEVEFESTAKLTGQHVRLYKTQLTQRQIREKESGA